MIKIKTNEVEQRYLKDIVGGTVFVGKIADYPDNLFVKFNFATCKPSRETNVIVSLNNIHRMWDTPECIVKDFKEVDIEITVL